MTNRTALDAVVDLEQRYPVANWTVGTLRVWPLLRVRIYFMLLFAAIGTGQAGAGQRSNAKRIVDAARGTWRAASSIVESRREDSAPRNSHTAILLGDGVSLAKIGGQWMDRLMDPIIAELTSERRDAFLMTPGTAAATPRYSPSLAVQPLLDASKAMGLLRAKLGSHPPHHLEGMSDALSDLAARNPAIAFPDQRWMIEHAIRVEQMAWQFGRLIARTSARLAFVSNYYGAEGMAFVLAARRAGAVTIDVQHGLQVDHVGYARWTNVPEPGYALLPDRFWCWSDEEARSIQDGMDSSAHRGVAVGNLWADFLASQKTGEIPAAIERLAGIRARSNRPYQFLLTPSWGHPDAELQKLLDAVALTRGEAKWWLRLHPSQAAEREPLRRRLSAMGIDDVELDAANDYPLPLLLREMDVNLTQDSSTAIEAAVAGVPSVVTTPNAAELFAPYLEKGQMRFARSPEAISQAALDLARDNPCRGHQLGETNVVALGRALAEALAMVPFAA